MPPTTDDQRLARVAKTVPIVIGITLSAYVWSTLLAFLVILLMCLLVILISALPQPSGDYGKTLLSIRIVLYVICGLVVALILITNKVVERFPDWSDSIVDHVIANQRLAEKSETVEFHPEENWQIAKSALKENRIIKLLKERRPRSVLLVPMRLVGEYIAEKARNTASWFAVGIIVILMLCCFAMFIGGKMYSIAATQHAPENNSERA